MVRCAECGFLAARMVSTREAVEVEPALRKTWELPGDGTGGTLFEPWPLCFAMAANLEEEMIQLAPKSPSGRRYVPGPVQVVEVINQQRDCPAFTPWKHGYSPKEHRQMLDLKENQRWQEEQRERDRQWQKEQKAGDRRWQLIMACVAPVIAAAIGLAGFILGKLFGN